MTNRVAAPADAVDLWTYPISEDPSSVRFLGSVAAEEIVYQDWPPCSTCASAPAHMSVRANHPLASRWLEVATRSPGTQVCIFWGHRPAGLWYWSGVLSEYRIERDPAGGGSILTLLIQGGVKALNDGLSVRSLANPMLGNDR